MLSYKCKTRVAQKDSGHQQLHLDLCGGQHDQGSHLLDNNIGGSQFPWDGTRHLCSTTRSCHWSAKFIKLFRPSCNSKRHSVVDSTRETFVSSANKHTIVSLP